MGDGEDKLDVSIAFMREHPGASDEELAQRLGLRRPASARFWRIKAMDVLGVLKEPLLTCDMCGKQFRPFSGHYLPGEYAYCSDCYS
jgi:ribosome-binding protein aMBF1 (putative translation factor)